MVDYYNQVIKYELEHLKDNIEILDGYYKKTNQKYAELRIEYDILANKYAELIEDYNDLVEKNRQTAIYNRNPEDAYREDFGG